jgi:hypothetical protein
MPTHSRRRLLIALAFASQLVPVPARAQSPTAAPAPKGDAPPGLLLLARGGPLCGEGHGYFVPAGRYKPQELDWARQTFGFIYLYRKGLDYPYILEYIADQPLPAGQAEALFKSPPYLDWLGSSGQAAMRELGAARALYLSHAADIEARNKGKPGAADKLPEVAALRQTRRAARAWLIDKMALQVKADKTAC